MDRRRALAASVHMADTAAAATRRDAYEPRRAHDTVLYRVVTSASTTVRSGTRLLVRSCAAATDPLRQAERIGFTTWMASNCMKSESAV